MSFSSPIPIASRKLRILSGRGMRAIFRFVSCLFSRSSISFVILSSWAGQIVNIQNARKSVHVPRCAMTVAWSWASLSSVAGLPVDAFSWGGRDEDIDDGGCFFFVVLAGIFVAFLEFLKNRFKSMLFKYSGPYLAWGTVSGKKITTSPGGKEGKLGKKNIRFPTSWSMSKHCKLL